jgi:hypothetical protein
MTTLTLANGRTIEVHPADSMTEIPRNALPLDQLAAELREGWAALDTAAGESRKLAVAVDRASSALNKLRTNHEDATALFEDKRLKLGALLAAAREQVEHGKWESWFRENVERHNPNHSYRDAQRMIKMATSADPIAARENEKRENREAQQRSRAAKATDTASVSRFWSDQTNKVVRPAPAPAASPASSEPMTDQPADPAPPAPRPPGAIPEDPRARRIDEAVAAANRRAPAALSEADRGAAFAQVNEICDRATRQLRGMQAAVLLMPLTDRVSAAAELLDALGITVDDLLRASPRKASPRLDPDPAPGRTRH